MKNISFLQKNNSIRSQFEIGIHNGHTSMNLSKKKYWHPFMSEFLLGIRHNTAIFNPYTTKKSILQAFYTLALVLRNNGRILVVNTHHEYSDFLRNLSWITLQNQPHQAKTNDSLVEKYKHLHNFHISYWCYKWVGGTLTNWKQISKSALTFAKFSERCEPFLMKNNINFPRYKKIKMYFQGLLHKKKTGQTALAFYEKPDVIFLLNPDDNRNVIAEANKLHIPVIAFVESNTNLHGISYPIPLNIYSMASVYYCLKKILSLTLRIQNTL